MCEFCDLSIPKDTLSYHLDYCGSRTEPCPLCQRFIMLKDMLQHESSGCQYPEVKEAPPTTDLNPFSMDDFQHMFDAEAMVSAPMFQEVDFRQDRLRNNASRNRTDAVTNKTTTVKTLAKSERRPRNSKLDVNVQRARNLATDSVGEDWQSSIPSDMDYDTMLALQLAHEDWFDDDKVHTDDRTEAIGGEGIATDHRNFFPDTKLDSPPNADPLVPSIEQDHRGNLTNLGYLQEEDLRIPCEFCEVDVPLVTYMSHVESCPLNTGVSGGRNNASPSNLQQRSNRTTIPVINNLRPGDSSLRCPNTLSAEEDVTLPCEFCEEMFPSEVIIQHQSVCQANGFASPRISTPVLGNRDSTSRSNPVSFQAITRTGPRHHTDPSLLEFVRDFSDEENERSQDFDYKSGTTRRTAPTVRESSSNKYSPAVSRFDGAFARPTQRPTRQHSTEEDNEGLNKAMADVRGSKSAQRTRARLNQLLQEDVSNGETPVSSSNLRKAKNTPKNVEKNKPGPKERKTQVNSRTVMRQLDGVNQRQSHGRTEESSVRPVVPGNRQRSDHVFSPELRLKPDHNPPPKKR